MSGADDSLVDGLMPLVARLRNDVSAVRRSGQPAAWTNQPLTRERIAHHLNGGPARGACPIKAGETTTMVAVLDFDSHRGEVSWSAMSAAVSRVIDELELVHGMNPLLFRSSGGAGVHVLLQWDTPQDAYSVRQFLRRVLESCGLRDGTGGVGAGAVEIFPKQDSVDPGKFGNMFILPCSNKSAPMVLDADDDEVLW